MAKGASRQDQEGNCDILAHSAAMIKSAPATNEKWLVLPRCAHAPLGDYSFTEWPRAPRQAAQAC
jgi:hypothetical protein